MCMFKEKVKTREKNEHCILEGKNYLLKLATVLKNINIAAVIQAVRKLFRKHR